jgi:hypothetical protein
MRPSRRRDYDAIGEATMSPYLRATAALLIPLLALTPSCAASRQEVRLQFEDGEVRVDVASNSGEPIQIPEPELWDSFRTSVRAVIAQSDPLAAAEQTFDVAEGSGTYRYYPRSGQLVAESGVEPMEDALTRGYLEWCGGTRLGGGDCLRLLTHKGALSLHGRYVVTLVMSMTASFGPMLDSLEGFTDPNAVAVMLASAVAIYLVLLLVPEPISKLISLSITGALIGYLGLTGFWDLVYGWRALAKTTDAATEFSELRRAARDFGRVLGPQIGQLLILLVSHSLGKGLAAKGAGAPPRMAEASAQGQRLLRVQLAASGAVRSATLGAGVITISLATSANAVSGSPSPQERGAGGIQGSKRMPMLNAPYQELQNGDALIGGRAYGGHALDQMRNRGVTPTVVENAIKTGVQSPDPVAGRTRFFDQVNRITVVMEGDRVVTVVPGRLRP